ncbi:MAG: hypothetical protein J2P17_31735 [Mycobacterium sp.]|nr:hypothetical protein [Mycobacterium sp.]
MKRIACLVAGLALLLGPAGCAAASASTKSKPRVNISWADEGKRITLSVGQALRLTLTGQTCTATSVPVASDKDVLQAMKVGSNEGTSWTQFTARHKGSVTVTATHGSSCQIGDFKPEKFTVTVLVH